MTNNQHPEPIPVAIEQALSRRFANVVAFSGAGMSAESGIPTFRSGSNGLWGEFNPAELATPEAWQANKALVWGWYEWRRGLIESAQPNAGHLALARLQQAAEAASVASMSAITQNVDNLHERAGVQNVMHLHGSMFAPRCASCGKPHTFAVAPPPEARREITPPICPHCTGAIRPGVVWFGENLDACIVGKAQQLIKACDLLLIVGTSGVVQPAASLVNAVSPSAVVIEINPDASGRLQRGFEWRTTAARGLPSLVDCLLRFDGSRSHDQYR